MSRTLQALRPAEAEAIVAVLNQLSQPIVDREVVLALRQNGYVLYDGDLTARPVAWLIEMGYDVCTKPYGNSVTPTLRAQVQTQTTWERVGANAEMTAWAQLALPQHRHPLDAALVRYYQGDRVQHSACLHYGDDPVTQDLPAWLFVKVR